MLTIRFYEQGPAHPDHYCEMFIKQMRKFSNMSEDKEIIISNEILVLALRAAVIQGKIDPNKFRFRLHKNKLFIRLDKDGNFIDPLPVGFCDVGSKYLDIVIGLDKTEMIVDEIVKKVRKERSGEETCPT
jgi:hypothetical protein